MPPAAAHLNTLIPPSTYFHGPFVAVDKLMDLFVRLQLPERVPPPTGEGMFSLKIDDYFIIVRKKIYDIVIP